MGFLCCGPKPSSSPPAPKTPLASVPKLVRRRSAPRPHASPNKIEEFYREGKQLQQAEQDEQERAALHSALQEEYRRGLLYDEDAKEIKESLDLGQRSDATSESGPSGIRSGAESILITRGISPESISDKLDVITEPITYPGPKIGEAREDSKPHLRSAVWSPPFNQLDPPFNNETKDLYQGITVVVPTVTSTQPPLAADESMKSIAPASQSHKVADTNGPEAGDPPKDGLRSMNAEPSSHSSSATVKTLYTELQKLGHDSPSEIIGLQTPSDSSETLHDPAIHLDDSPPLYKAEQQSKPETNNPQNTSNSGRSDSDHLTIPSEELFSRLPALLKPSTSTFFGSVTSYADNRRFSAAGSEVMSYPRRVSRPSLDQGPFSRNDSKRSLFMSSTNKRRDSTSSFYPSMAGSQIQSLQGSLIDVPMGSMRIQAATLPKMYVRRRSLEQFRGINPATGDNRGARSQGLNQFEFPWSEDTYQASATERTAPILEGFADDGDMTPRKAKQPVISDTAQQRNIKGATKSQERTSTITDVLNFVKSGVTGTDYRPSSSGLTSPGSTNTQDSKIIDASTTTPKRYSSYRPETPKSGKTIRARLSFYSKHDPLPDSSEHSGESSIRRSMSSKESKSFSSWRVSKRADTPEHANEGEGRFDNLTKGSLHRSRSLTAKRSFTASMAKIREKVGIVGFKNVPQTPGSEERPRVISREVSDTEAEMNDIQFSPTLPDKLFSRSIQEDSGTDTSGGNGNIILHRASIVRTMPTRRGRTAASSHMGIREPGTLYDDCVAHPFPGDMDGACDEDTPYFSTTAAFQRPANHQAEEYQSEREFWYKRSKLMRDSPPKTIGIAH